jgi:hypothetical protein
MLWDKWDKGTVLLSPRPLRKTGDFISAFSRSRRSFLANNLLKPHCKKETAEPSPCPSDPPIIPTICSGKSSYKCKMPNREITPGWASFNEILALARMKSADADEIRFRG